MQVGVETGVGADHRTDFEAAESTSSDDGPPATYRTPHSQPRRHPVTTLPQHWI